MVGIKFWVDYFPECGGQSVLSNYSPEGGGHYVLGYLLSSKWWVLNYGVTIVR